MKILLMVKDCGRVVCKRVASEAARYYADCSQRTLDIVLAPYGRWWLVEAQSAEEARGYVRDQYADDAPGLRAECARHILAYSGKHAE